MLVVEVLSMDTLQLPSGNAENKQKGHIKACDLLYLAVSNAQICSESIAHEAEGQISYPLKGHEGERNNCFIKIQLVGKKYRYKTTLAS